MKRGQITFLIIPQGRRSVRELRVSTTVLKLIFCLMMIGLVATAYLATQFVEHRRNLAALAELEEAHRVQGESLQILAGKVSFFEKKIGQLNDFDRKIRIISNLEVPDDEDGNSLFGVGGSVPDDDSSRTRLSATERSLIDEIHRDIDQLLEDSTAQERSFRELVEYLKTQKSILARTPSIWPVMGWVTSEFGNRKSPFTDRREFHNGIDIAARHGKEIVAPANGVVKAASRDRHMGNLIWIDHGNDLLSCYGHLREHAVKTGQQVKRGDVIGYVGNTGRSTGPHLHYGIMLKGEYVNPRRYLF